MNTTSSRRFSPAKLERTIDLVEAVDAQRWEVNTAKENERRLLCEFWACRARALLEEQLGDDDRGACLWVLHVVKGIAYGTGFFIKGLGRNDRDDWAARARAGGARLRANRRRDQQAPPSKPKSKVAERRMSHRKDARSFPNLVGTTLLVVGGDQDIAVLDRYRKAGINLEWVPGNVRQVEASADRIRRGGVDGVIFLTDRNPHAFQTMVRDACRYSDTSFEFSASGIASIEGTLQRLSDRKEPMPHSA